MTLAPLAVRLVAGPDAPVTRDDVASLYGISRERADEILNALPQLRTGGRVSLWAFGTVARAMMGAPAAPAAPPTVPLADVPTWTPRRARG